MADVSMSATAFGLELLDELHQHTEDYPSTAKKAFVELADVWADLETPCDQQQEELAGVLKAVRQCWAGAVSSAHQQQQAVRDSIQQMLAEMMETKEALGAAADPAAEAELSRLQVRQRVSCSGVSCLVFDQVSAADSCHSCSGC
jgi:uncharacterized protein YukE